MSHPPRHPAVRTFTARKTAGFVLHAHDVPGLRPVRKKEVDVTVSFAGSAGALETPEGRVRVRPGDALVTGHAGDRWRVPAAQFRLRYVPVPPVQAGGAGRYRSRPLPAQAARMNESFEVRLADGVSRLRGEPGEWLLDYGDGSLAVVSAAAFEHTYELLD